MKCKPAFKEKYSKLTDLTAYEEAIKTYAKKSIRVNTLLYNISNVRKSLQDDGWTLEPIPLCKQGFYIEHETGRRDIGNTKQHKEGMFFSQGAPSMLPAQLLKLTPRSTVLDLCAAPGGKTQHMACLMNNKGTIIANDHNLFRLNILKKNMQRCGVKNVTTTRQRAQDFISKQTFDAILIDAPCTGSGLIKGKIARTKKLLKEWNPKVIAKHAQIQQAILQQAWQYLQPQGRLVYATCSLEPEEDEDIIKNFLNKHDDCNLVQPSKINGYAIQSSLPAYIKIWPQYYDTQGFFVATLEKT